MQKRFRITFSPRQAEEILDSLTDYAILKKEMGADG